MNLRNRWILAVPVLLIAHVSLMSWAVVKATTDPNATVIPDYYAKSTHWDMDKAQQATSDALGWKVSLSILGGRDPLKQSPFALVLTDATGTPIPAIATLTYYHNTHPKDLQHVSLTPNQTTYAPIPYPGFYTLTLRATQGSKIFTRTWTQHLQP